MFCVSIKLYEAQRVVVLLLLTEMVQFEGAFFVTSVSLCAKFYTFLNCMMLYFGHSNRNEGSRESLG